MSRRRGFAPAPPGFGALLPLPMRGPTLKKGCRSIPPQSVEASETARAGIVDCFIRFDRTSKRSSSSMPLRLL